MISRHWTGIAKKERANEYIEHLQHDTFKKIKAIPGFIAAKILKREVEDGTEFLIITDWDSLDTIKQFAGTDVNIAVIPKLVQDIMIRYDENVRHYEIKYTTGQNQLKGIWPNSHSL
jgi:heme-degrading monooxygenase HmoA